MYQGFVLHSVENDIPGNIESCINLIFKNSYHLLQLNNKQQQRLLTKFWSLTLNIAINEQQYYLL